MTTQSNIAADAARIAIVGGGPAGLIAAERLAGAGFGVDIFDRMPSPARKFLMAGRGGLNLTHSELPERFLTRYGAAAGWLEPMIAAFGPDELRRWAEGLGQETFVGSSGRVFPRSMKASPLLRAWLARLEQLGVVLHARHDWTGWTPDGALAFATTARPVTVRPAATLLALGGASWPRLGADGGWVPLLRARDVAVTPLTASNAGIHCGWSARLAERFSGQPLKNIALTCRGVTARGEMILTRTGLEGGVIYALSGAIRQALSDGAADALTCDLRPDVPVQVLAARLTASRRGDTVSNRLRKAGLPAVAIALMQEQAAITKAPLAGLSGDALARLAKALPIPLAGMAGLERAISTAGGIGRTEVTDALMLRRLPGVFVAGEMLDWDAPTGGYLLQACFATGVRAAEGITQWLCGGLSEPR